MIHLDNVCKQYRRGDQTVHALRPTTVDVTRGDFVAVVGPSGSGKSTLLSMVGGMLAPTSGRILLDDVSIYDEPISARCRMRNQKIGFVFQSFNLVPWLTAVENVQLPLSLYGRDDGSRAEELLARFGLADRMHHKPLELSAGQQQRVALARTLATDPPLILADEPTGNLDPASRDMVLETFASLR
ncbi:MAG: ABC transporter ATP-binding protein, partial [Planctomycetota bacterium]